MNHRIAENNKKKHVTFRTQMSRFGTLLSSGVTIRFRYNRKKNYSRFLFMYFEQTLVQITIFFHLDVNILNIIILCYTYMLCIYKICSTYIYIYIYIYIYTRTRNTLLKYIWFSLQINGGGGAVQSRNSLYLISIHFCDTLNLFTKRKLKWQKATSHLFSFLFSLYNLWNLSI